MNGKYKRMKKSEIDFISNRRHILKSSSLLAGLSFVPQSVTAQTSTDDDLTKNQLESVLHHDLNDSFTDKTGNGIIGEPGDQNVDFVEDETREIVLELSGRGSTGGFYDIPYESLTQSINDGDPVTVALWIKPEQLDSWHTIIAGLGVDINIRNGNLRLQRYDRETREVAYRAAIEVTEHLTTNEWHHIVGTVEPGNEARLFVDGELVATEEVSEGEGYTQRSGLDQARVGWVTSGNPGAYDGRFDGRIDDLRVYKGSVEMNDVEQLYSGPSREENPQESGIEEQLQDTETNTDPRETESDRDSQNPDSDSTTDQLEEALKAVSELIDTIFGS